MLFTKYQAKQQFHHTNRKMFDKWHEVFFPRIKIRIHMHTHAHSYTHSNTDTLKCKLWTLQRCQTLCTKINKSADSEVLWGLPSLFRDALQTPDLHPLCKATLKRNTGVWTHGWSQSEVSDGFLTSLQHSGFVEQILEWSAEIKATWFDRFRKINVFKGC